MHYNKSGTFMTTAEFKKVKSSFELKNEKKLQNMRMKIWGWEKMPTIIKHWELIDGMVQIPHGLRSFWKFENQYPKIGKVAHPEISNPYKGNEMDLKQNKAMNQLLKKDIGYGHMSTGIGKTMITAKIIKEKSVKTLIVVSGIELMNQMKKDLLGIFGEKYPTIDGKTGIVKQILIEDPILENKILHVESLIVEKPLVKYKKRLKLLKEERQFNEVINEKKLAKVLSSNIVIANIDTLTKMPHEKFFQEFDLTIMDEVDCYFSSDNRRDMMWKKITSKYVYGLTGTIKVNYIPAKIFDIYLGAKTELLIKHFEPKIYKVLTDFHFILDDIKEFHLLKEALYEDEKRNNMIVKTIMETIGNNKGVVFSEYIEHAKVLKEELENKGMKCFLMIGEVKEQERLEIKKELSEYDGPCVLIGSVKIIGRGFNLPELSVGYLTTCEKFISNIEQYVGRIIRTCEGKTEAKWYDFVDSGCRVLLNQSKNRTTTYKKEFPNSSIEFYNFI